MNAPALQVILTDAQLDDLAERIARKLAEAPVPTYDQDHLPPWWGMPVPESAEKAYGARAIYEHRKRRNLDFLHDRISFRGKIPKKDLSVILNHIRWILKDRMIQPGDTQVLSGRTPKRPDYLYTASPRASQGYIYIGIWYDPEKKKT